MLNSHRNIHELHTRLVLASLHIHICQTNVPDQAIILVTAISQIGNVQLLKMLQGIHGPK